MTSDNPSAGPRTADVQIIMRRVRERIRGVDREHEWARYGRKSVPQQLVASVARMRVATTSLRAAISRIGIPPPAPATVRGRVGMTAVLMVRRAMFWLLPPIQVAQTQLVDAMDQHLAATEEILQLLRHTNSEVARLEHLIHSGTVQAAAGADSREGNGTAKRVLPS